MAFDPDQYLAAKQNEGAGFDPDAYLAQKAEASKPSEPGAFDGIGKSVVDSLPMIGGVIGGALGTPADAFTGPGGTLVGAGIGGYLGSATKNLINRYVDPKAAPQTATQAIAQPLASGAEQAAMQGAGEIAAPYISKAVQGVANAGSSAAKWGASKLLSSFGSVRPEVIGEYAKFSDRINAAPTVEALKDISDEAVGKLSADVEAKKLTADQAKEAYKGLHSDLKDAYQTAGFDARNAVTSAQQTLKDAHGARIQQLSGDVYDTLNKLKSEVQAGSGEALKTLDKSDQMIKLKPIYEEINSQIARAEQSGTKESMSLAKELTDYRDNLAQAVNRSGKINPVDAKRRIQGLDQITEYNPMAGSFDKTKNTAFKAIRSAFDGSVKSTVPEYAEAMKPVAEKADLLNRVSDFGDKQSAASILQRIHAPNQMERRAALQELGQKYGVDFAGAAKPESLPEQQLLNKALAKQNSLRSDRVAEKLDQTLTESRQKAAFDSAQAGLDAAQEKLAPFKSLAPNGAGQTQAQQKLVQLGRGNNIELEGMFKELGKLTNTDFVQAMKDRHILSAFEKGATNGSRNTLMGATVGWAFGGLGGGAIGASAGRAVDQWGPAMTKKILDGAIRVSKSPTIETISQLQLPDPIKRNMIVGLQNYISKGGQLAEQSAARVAGSPGGLNRAPAVGQDKWAQAGIQKLGIQDAELTSRLMQDPKAKQLLIQASDLKPGSKAMKAIMDQINSKWSRQ